MNLYKMKNRVAKRAAENRCNETAAKVYSHCMDPALCCGCSCRPASPTLNLTVS